MLIDGNRFTRKFWHLQNKTKKLLLLNVKTNYFGANMRSKVNFKQFSKMHKFFTKTSLKIFWMRFDDCFKISPAANESSWWKDPNKSFRFHHFVSCYFNIIESKLSIMIRNAEMLKFWECCNYFSHFIRSLLNVWKNRWITSIYSWKTVFKIWAEDWNEHLKML